jgi:hypothetical protein
MTTKTSVAQNDTLPDDGDDYQKQAPPELARFIGDALLSMIEESSPSALAMDDEEDGDDYDIEDLADALFPRHQLGQWKQLRCALAITKEDAKVLDWFTLGENWLCPSQRNSEQFNRQ